MVDEVHSVVLVGGEAGATLYTAHPLEVVVCGEYSFYKHKGGCINSYRQEDQIPLIVPSILPRDDVNVKENKAQNCIDEQPKLSHIYHEPTKKTLSISYFFPPEPELPLVPHDTSSTLQNAWMTIV